jgi:hypothetical protein
MLKPSLFLKLIFIGSTLALNLLLIPLPLQAQDDPVPPGTGGTGDTKPGGPRPGAAGEIICLVDGNSQGLTAIILDTEQRELTTLSHPTILIYIPKTKAKTADFVVFDHQSDSPVYKTAINLPKEPGIIAITIPKDQPELQPGIYRWTVSLVCDSPKPPSVRGMIQRVQPNSELTEALQKTPAEQWSVYAQAGIWYDAIATLATLRQAQPNNPQLESDWKKLLQQVKLDALVTAPLIQP